MPTDMDVPTPPFTAVMQGTKGEFIFHYPLEPLAAMMQELTKAEFIFHYPEEFLASPEDVADMIHPDFHQIGASGMIYTRWYALDLIAKRFKNPAKESRKVSKFRVRQLAPALYLLNYNLTQNHTCQTRRTSIWRRNPAGWQIVFHQGTIIQN